MKVLFVVPEIRLDSAPNHFPFSSIIFLVPTKKIIEEISSEKWDLIGIGGLTTTYARIKQLAPLIRKYSPDSLFIGGGGWSTYNPIEILKLIPELNLIVIGEGEATFSELYDEVNGGSKNFAKIDGLCYRDENNELKFSGPRALISDLNTVPFPAYDLMETEIYFKYSSLNLSDLNFFNCIFCIYKVFTRRKFFNQHFTPFFYNIK